VEGCRPRSPWTLKPPLPSRLTGPQRRRSGSPWAWAWGPTICFTKVDDRPSIPTGSAEPSPGWRRQQPCLQSASTTSGTFATLALDAGVKVWDVSDILGHANISITLDLYRHAVSDTQAEATVKVASLFDMI